MEKVFIYQHFLPVSLLPHIGEKGHRVPYSEGKGCIRVLDLVTEAKSYSWVSGECTEISFRPESWNNPRRMWRQALIHKARGMPGPPFLPGGHSAAWPATRPPCLYQDGYQSVSVPLLGLGRPLVAQTHLRSNGNLPRASPTCC